MGANLDRLMKSYGVSTPTVSGYSGVAAPAALAAGATAEEKGTYASALAKYKNELDAYDRYVGDYKNRIATTDLYSSPYLNILPKSEQKYQTGNTITTPDYSALASPVTDINNIRTTPDYDSLVKAAYAGVGRSGIGSEGKNIDQAGYDYWSNQLKNNAISPADFKSTFSSSAKDYVAKNTNDPITTVMRNYRPANAENPMYDALIKSAYSGVGRSGVGSNMGNIDQPGYDYWMNQLNTGAVNPANFTSAFSSGAKSYIDQNPGTDTSKYMRGYLKLSPAVTGGNGSIGSASGNGSIGSASEGVITEAMMAANPYLRAGFNNPYNGRGEYEAEMAKGGPVRHFYGGGSNSIDGGITDLADKYALDNPAELPEIYAQAPTGTATDAVPASVAQRTVGGVVSPPSGFVPVSDTTLQKLQASAVKVGELPIQRGSPGQVEGAPVREEPKSPQVAPATVMAPQSADDEKQALFDKWYKPKPPSDAVIAARKNVADNQAALLKAINDQIGKSEENAPSKAEMYFRLAAAFAAPTKTGNFMENVGLAAKELGDFQKSTTDSKRAAAAARLQMLLKTNEITWQTAKEELAALEKADNEERKSRQEFAKEIFKSNEKRNEAVTDAEMRARSLGLITGTADHKAYIAADEAERATKAATAADAAKTAAKAAEKKLGALPEYELRLRTEAEDVVANLTKSAADLYRAFAINPQTFKSSWPDDFEKLIKEGIGTNDPIAIKTREQRNLLLSQALTSLKSTFPGAISNDERVALENLQGIGAKTQEERATIMMNAYKAVQSSLERNKKRIDRINAGEFRRIEQPGVGATDGQ